MRKIKHSCGEAQLHHALAVLAITQAGMMRGFRSSEGIHHEVVLDEEGLRGRAGHYRIKPDTPYSVICHTESATGCWVRWFFTWPDLKLLCYETMICECTGWQVDPVPTH